MLLVTVGAVAVMAVPFYQHVSHGYALYLVPVNDFSGTSLPFHLNRTTGITLADSSHIIIHWDTWVTRSGLVYLFVFDLASADAAVALEVGDNWS